MRLFVVKSLIESDSGEPSSIDSANGALTPVRNFAVYLTLASIQLR